MNEQAQENLEQFLYKDRIATPREIWQVFLMGYKTTPLLNTLAIGLQFGRKVFTPLQIWISKLIIDSIISLATAQDTSIHAKQSITFLLLCEFGLIGLDKLTEIISDWIRERRDFIYELNIQENIMHKALSLDMSYFDNHAFTNHFYYLAGGFISTPWRTFDWLVDTCSSLWGFIVYIPILITFDIRVLFLAILSPLLLYAIRLLMEPAIRQTREKSWAMERKAYYLAELASSYEYAKEVRIFNLKVWLIDSYNKIKDSIYTFKRKNRKLGLLDNSLDFLFTQICYYLAYAISIFDAIAGKISVGSLTMVIQSFRDLRIQASALFRSFATDLPKDIAQFAIFLNLQPQLKQKTNTVKLKKNNFQTLEVKDATFSYQTSKSPALNHISLNIKKGEHIAFVGDNGSGKTTLIKLLLRLYDPQTGQVLVNGQDIRNYDQTDIWSLYSIIFQDYIRYRLSVEENIHISDIYSDTQVVPAAELAGADEFINKLPDQYQTILNKRYPGDEEAHELSEGQWQKIALARAFYREAPILILDEPTASVDAKTEYKLYKFFKEQARDKTLILVSHHFSSVRFADRILVFEQGKIIETGTHAELIELKGKYAEMFQMQMEGLQGL